MKLDIEKLKILQAQNCFENQELAEKANIGVVTLRKIKKGTTIPRLITIGKIAKALNVNVIELLER